MSTAGESERKGGTGWKSSMDTYTLPCAEEIAHGKMLQSTGAQLHALMAQRRGGMRGGWGGGSRRKRIYVYLQLIYTVV